MHHNHPGTGRLQRLHRLLNWRQRDTAACGFDGPCRLMTACWLAHNGIKRAAIYTAAAKKDFLASAPSDETLVRRRRKGTSSQGRERARVDMLRWPRCGGEGQRGGPLRSSGCTHRQLRPLGPSGGRAVVCSLFLVVADVVRQDWLVVRLRTGEVPPNLQAQEHLQLRHARLVLQEVDEAALHRHTSIHGDTHAAASPTALPVALQQADGLRMHRAAVGVEHGLQVAVDEEELRHGRHHVRQQVRFHLLYAPPKEAPLRHCGRGLRHHHVRT
mmetsp:Transcript_39775/g.100871  ORF Transcript_39775/g.100871 Transcript_39775/m.100871 type:complete len:272 (-) Transcript_39775:61-876(-)